MRYHHSKHAGNFGDVIKHVIHVQILNFLTKQPLKVVYLESHSGPGLLSLNNCINAKYHNGIGKIWQYKQDEKSPLPVALQQYFQYIKNINPTNQLKTYPGSPLLAQKILDKSAELKLFELCESTYTNLVNLTSKDNHVTCICSDGFKGVIEEPIDKHLQAYLLIDPPYKNDDEYKQATNTFIKFHRRHPNALVALWYPLKNQKKIERLKQDLKASVSKPLELFEIAIKTSKKEVMRGAGMIVVNSPVHLYTEMQTSLPLISKILGNSEANHYHLQTIN